MIHLKMRCSKAEREEKIPGERFRQFFIFVYKYLFWKLHVAIHYSRGKKTSRRLSLESVRKWFQLQTMTNQLNVSSLHERKKRILFQLITFEFLLVNKDKSIWASANDCKSVLEASKIQQLLDLRQRLLFRKYILY